MTRIVHASAALLAGTLLLAACGRDEPAAPSAGGAQGTAQHEPTTMFGRAARKGIDKARSEILAGNISLSGDVYVRGPNLRIGDGKENPSRPKAELTPQGDLLIEGKKVAVDASQQALLQRYRGQIEQVALAGLEIGAEGADLAGKAVGEAISGIFGGDPDSIEKRVEAEAAGIKVAAQKLCAQLPGLHDTQQALAASLPAFKPYATMEQKDIDECYRDDHATATTRSQTRDEVRTEVREGIREGVRNAVQAATGAVDDVSRRNNAAAEAEDASVEQAQQTPPANGG